jgi:hypothetical protein
VTVDLDRIGEAFYRAGNSERITGHRLGLWPMGKIITWHQELIQTESVVHVGTRFIVLFAFFWLLSVNLPGGN